MGGLVTTIKYEEGEMVNNHQQKFDPSVPSHFTSSLHTLLLHTHTPPKWVSVFPGLSS